ncbi:TSUP family transporter [Tessaracoccus palaemonis]|uniref:Probable membrane transporter protein n=1 Tax=Tessaracoccus palaemonis TaxID=2829499 RepID=A0ABX8SKF7_9ACTN|nr:TSUP family transporter [Tessaracoccus palaemonis]QXT62910.1 TSUP family transporter [Tessaracoccus palaemonis]
MPLVLASVFAGAVLQRTSGIGFAIVVAPFVILAVGPAQGITLVQLFGASSALLVLFRVLRDTDWRTFGFLVPTSLIGVAVGAVVATAVPQAEAQALAAMIMLVALISSTIVGRLRSVRRSPGLLLGAGGVAGVMTSVAGVGAVALTATRDLTGWEQRSFLATLQPYLIALSAATVAARVAVDPGTWPVLSPGEWIASVCFLVAGIAVGDLVSRRVPVRAAALITWGLALCGAVITLVDALLSMS